MKPNFADDITLLKELRNGNEEALKYIFEKWYPALCYFALGFVEYCDAEDIVMGVYTNLWCSEKKFDNKKVLRAWLYVSTKNACLNYIAKKKTENKYIKFIRGLCPSNKKLPPTALECELLNEIRLIGVKKLPPDLRKTFELMLREFKNPEIGEILGISTKEVAYNKYRVRYILRDYLNNSCKE